MKFNGQTKSFFKKDTIQLILRVFGLVFVGLNIWLTYQLAPLVQNISTLSLRVSAAEKTLDERAKIIERFIVIEQVTKDIKEAIVRIENKVDRIINK